MPVKVAIPCFGEHVAPCFEYSAVIRIYPFQRRRIVDQADFCLQSRDALDRIRLLRDQGVDALICGGVQDRFEDMLKAHEIEVISWVEGDVTALVERYLRGELVPGTARLEQHPQHQDPRS